VRTRNLGDEVVSAIGLGGMPLSIEDRPDRAQSIATIHAALDAGITFIDTADAYHRDADDLGHNELLIAEALKSYGGSNSTVIVATKGGSLRPGDGSWYQDGRSEYLKEAAKASAKRMGVDAIDLWQFHRPDENVPYADSLGAVAELLDEGVIRLAGISNANPDEIRLAQEILGGRLTSVQNQYSPAFRSSQPELDLCDQLGIAFLPWSPLGGITSAADLGSSFAPFAEVAAELDVSPQQVALAWELAQSPHVIAIPGSRRAETIEDSAAAADLTLSPEQKGRLDAV